MMILFDYCMQCRRTLHVSMFGSSTGSLKRCMQICGFFHIADFSCMQSLKSEVPIIEGL